MLHHNTPCRQYTPRPGAGKAGRSEATCNLVFYIINGKFQDRLNGKQEKSRQGKSKNFLGELEKPGAPPAAARVFPTQSAPPAAPEPDDNPLRQEYMPGAYNSERPATGKNTPPAQQRPFSLIKSGQSYLPGFRPIPYLNPDFTASFHSEALTRRFSGMPDIHPPSPLGGHDIGKREFSQSINDHDGPEQATAETKFSLVAFE